jgi:hypothetical protein
VLTAASTFAAALKPVIVALVMRQSTSDGKQLATPLVTAWYEALLTLPACASFRDQTRDRSQPPSSKRRGAVCCRTRDALSAHGLSSRPRPAQALSLALGLHEGSRRFPRLACMQTPFSLRRRTSSTRCPTTSADERGRCTPSAVGRPAAAPPPPHRASTTSRPHVMTTHVP